MDFFSEIYSIFFFDNLFENYFCNYISETVLSVVSVVSNLLNIPSGILVGTILKTFFLVSLWITRKLQQYLKIIWEFLPKFVNLLDYNNGNFFTSRFIYFFRKILLSFGFNISSVIFPAINWKSSLEHPLEIRSAAIFLSNWGLPSNRAKLCQNHIVRELIEKLN